MLTVHWQHLSKSVLGLCFLNVEKRTQYSEVSKNFYCLNNNIYYCKLKHICNSNRMVSSAINVKFETMRLLVNRQFIPIPIQPESISLEQICYKRSQNIAVNSLHCLLFLTSKNKDLKRISKSATNIMLALKFLWTSKFVFPQ